MMVISRLSAAKTQKDDCVHVFRPRVFPREWIEQGRNRKHTPVQSTRYLAAYSWSRSLLPLDSKHDNI